LINIVFKKIDKFFGGKQASFYIKIFSLYFLVSFCSKVAKNIKESILLTIPGGDAVLLPSIKLYLSLPFAFLVIGFFNWLSNRYSQKAVFTLFVSIISVWFFAFGFFIHPHYEEWALVEMGNFLNDHLPMIFAPIGQLVTYWGPTLFYIVADLLPNLIISLLLWSFIVDITTPEQGVRLFPILGLDLPGVFAGLFCTYIANASINLGFLTGWEASVAATITCICVALGAALVIFWSLPTSQNHSCTLPKSTNQQFSLKQNLSVVQRNPLLLYMTLALFIFEMTSGLINIIWKDIVLKIYPTSEEYSSFMGFSATLTGIIGMLCTLFVVPKLFRFQKSSVNILITPTILAISNTVFFTVILLYETSPQYLWVKFSVILLAVGLIHTLLMQILKFAFFDPFKELSLQSLDPIDRRQGKTISDVIGNRCGKGACPLSYQFMMTIGLSSASMAMPIALTTTILLGIWLISSLTMIKKQKQEVCQ
jgi:ATP:ADP antiporter, AAA family